MGEVKIIRLSEVYYFVISLKYLCTEAHILRSEYKNDALLFPPDVLAKARQNINALTFFNKINYELRRNSLFIDITTPEMKNDIYDHKRIYKFNNLELMRLFKIGD